MKKILFWVLAAGLSACTHSHDNHSHEEEAGGLEPLAFTLYSEKTELFVEFKPLVVGGESRFAAHFTALGDSFKAISEGSVTLTLEGPAGKQSVTAEKPDVPGIFRLALTPEKPGLGRLVFDIVTPDYSDRIVIDSVGVYPNDNAAAAGEQGGAGSGSEITYLKEQAWKIDFANMPVRRIPFYQIVKSSGLIMPVPGADQMLSAATPGIVSLGGKSLLPGAPVTAGQALFTISSKSFTDGNADLRLAEAKNNFDRAKAGFERNQQLLEDRLITQQVFLDSKNAYENARSVLNSLTENYSPGGQRIKAGQSGFIKSVLVAEGQYAEAGQPLAVISKNDKLIVKVELSQTAFSRIGRIISANFRVNDRRVYSLKELNGRVVSIGQSAENAHFIPVFFEISNREGLMSGAYTEVFIQTDAVQDALVLPFSALMEEQGNYFCYVQTGGESFEKRELLLGGNDGKQVQVLSGIAEGDRVVTKGAYNIKLSTASGALPAHGHSH